MATKLFVLPGLLFELGSHFLPEKVVWPRHLKLQPLTEAVHLMRPLGPRPC